MSYHFLKRANSLLLEYNPDNDPYWIKKKFEENEELILGHVFYLSQEDLYESNIEDFEFFPSYRFVIGYKSNNYYKIEGNYLNINVDLYIHNDISINIKLFRTYRNVSIFRKVAHIVKEDIFLGGKQANLPYPAFKELLGLFPNSYELDRYSEARISSLLRDYFDFKMDYQSKYESYMNNKYSFIEKENIIDFFASQELEKYKLLLKKIRYMLSNEDNYTEQQWQTQIIQIIQLLYPKYIRVFEKVRIKDTDNKDRELDLMLLDSRGNLDLIEIKKPFGRSIMSKGKYRDNYIPLRELSGSVMQIEKYIYYLNMWGRAGEKRLTDKYSERIPEELSIRIVNPVGIIIIGLEKSLSAEQKEDFEIVKRKYRNIVDIITYDEMVKRLELIIEKFELN